MKRQHGARSVFAAIEEVTIDENGRIIIAGAEDASVEDVVASAQIGEAAAISEVENSEVVVKTFSERMLEADKELQNWYNELKNYALRYKKVKSRISRKFDSINKGRIQFIKLGIGGKTLKLFLNMDLAATDPKFHCKDMSGKITYITVPVQMRVKSARGVGYSKILIDKCAEFLGLSVAKKAEEVDSMLLIREHLAASKQ